MFDAISYSNQSLIYAFDNACISFCYCVCYVLICISSRSSSINIININTNTKINTCAAWETGLLSSRHGYCNRWRQSHSRWPLQGKLKIFIIHIYTSYSWVFDVYIYISLYSYYSHIHRFVQVISIFLLISSYYFMC